MRNRHFYAHWLDPDYLGIRALGDESLERRLTEFEGIIKMHAILGDSIRLGDVQLTESQLLLRLFGNREFRGFLSHHPDFLLLVGRAGDDLGGKSQRLAIVTSGLSRIMKLGTSYFSHTYSSPDTMREVARLFDGITDENAAEGLFAAGGAFSRLVNNCQPSDKAPLLGLQHALEHFLFNTRTQVLPSNPKSKLSSYYQELEIAHDLTSNSDNGSLKRELSDILKLGITKEEREKRTLVTLKLANANKVGHPDRHKYLTVIQAWNVAVSRTIGAENNSAFVFRDSFPIPTLLGRTTGCSAPISSAAEGDLFLQLPRFDWHPSSVAWGTLSRIIDKCGNAIDNYQESIRRAVSSGDAQVQQKLKALGEAAGKVIAEDHIRLPAPPPWLPSSIILAGGALSLGALVLHAAVPPVASIGGVSVAAYVVLSSAIKWGSAAEIGQAIETYAQQYNIQQTGIP